jgi:hypothetical protein
MRKSVGIWQHIAYSAGSSAARGKTGNSTGNAAARWRWRPRPKYATGGCHDDPYYRRHPDRSAPRLGLRFAVGVQDTSVRLSFS